MTRAVDEGTGFSISGTELTASSYRKKLTLILSHPLYPQINFWWVVDLNIKSKTIKLLEGIVFATLGSWLHRCLFYNILLNCKFVSWTLLHILYHYPPPKKD